ncbi:MAG: T9SS type A sorting domain-containing protein [Bacteroidetes bacterium]|nr:T9SS type A sorting domain-containing protein [Bacteroidota bacterium]
MRKLTLFVLFLMSFVLMTSYLANAQSTANYTLTTNTNGSLAADMNGNTVDMTTGATSLLAAGTDDTSSPLTSIGFDFFFMASRYTQFSISDNGIITMGTTTTTGQYVIGGNSTPVLAPFANDMRVGTDGIVRYKVVGSAPNRTLVIEWSNTMIRYLSTAAAGTATFQARLYESTGVIEYIYGTMTTNSAATNVYYVGFSNNTTALNIMTLNTNTNATNTTITQTSNSYSASSTITDLNSASNGSRKYYRFTPPVRTAPTSLSFTSVGSSSMTLNWTDNATGENGYVIYNSTDGGTTYNFVQTAAANAVTANVTGLTLSTTYQWKVFAYSEGGFSTALTGTQATSGPVTKTASTGGWNTPGTWTPSGVPSSTDNVVIPDGVTVTIDATGLVCYNLTVGGGTSGVLQYQATPTAGLLVSQTVTVNAGATFTAGSGSLTTATLGIGTNATTATTGSLTNNGTFDMNTTAGVITTFFGNQNGTISGSGGTTDFYTITLNKGTTQTGAILDVTSVITMRAIAASALGITMTAGTLKISSATTITPWGGSQTIIGLNSRLWLNNASCSILAGSAGAPTINGELRIDNGTFTYGSGNNTMTFGTSGVLNMSGGTLNMNGAVAWNAASTSQLLMSGGNFNIDINATNALTTGTAALTINSTMTVVWSGGTITIVDPHSAAGGTAFSGTTGGTKTITGGTLQIGDGTSTTSGGTLSNTSGFGLTSTMSLWNLSINNRTDGSTSRMARLLSDITVLNSITIQSNAYLFVGSATTTRVLTLTGNTFTNSGTLAGDIPGGTTQFLGTLALSPTSGTIALSGAGKFAALSTIQNSGDVTLSQTDTFVVNRINLFRGLFTRVSNFKIGRPTSIAIIQVGGNGGVADGGSFDAVPTIVTTAGSPSYFYSTSTANPVVMGNYNEMAAGDVSITQFLLNNTNGLTVNRNVTLVRFLSMTAGNFNFGTYNLTMGSSTNIDTILYTAGLLNFTTGTISRYFPTTGLPTTMGTLAAAGTNKGFYPIAYNGNNRNFSLSFSVQNALSTGGYITVSHSNNSGTTSISSYTDAAVSVDTRSNASWTVTQSGCVLTGTINSRIQGSGGLFLVNTLANLRMVNSTLAAFATSSNGTNTVTDPQVNRTGMNLTNLVSTFYFGGNSADIGSVISWVGTTGNWSDPTNWSSNPSLPTSTDNVSIAPGSAGTITVDGNYAVNSLTCGTNATISLGVNTLTVNGSLTQSAGVITLGSGTLNVKGNFTKSSGTFTQGTGTLSLTGTAASQTITFGGSQSLYNLTMSGGSSGGFSKIFTVSQTLTVGNNYTVETTAKLALTAATSTTHNIAGNLVYSGATGGSNIGSLTLNMTGSGKTIDGSVTDNFSTGINSISSANQENRFDTKYQFVKNDESENAIQIIQRENLAFDYTTRSQNDAGIQPSFDLDRKDITSKEEVQIVKNGGDKESVIKNEEGKEVKTIDDVKPRHTYYYTYERMKSVVDRIFEAQRPNERIIIILEDATLIKNPDEGNLDVATTTFEFNLTIATAASITLNDNISMNTGRTLTVNGRLNCGTQTVGGAGNITVVGATQSTAAGVVGTSNTSSAGFNNFTASGTINWTTGGTTVGMVDYMANADQTINITNHPANTFIMCSTGGIKTQSADYTFSANSDCGVLSGSTPATNKGTLFVNSGATYADGGFAITTPNSNTPYNHFIVSGGFTSTGSGKIRMLGSTVSYFMATNGVTFGELQFSYSSTGSWNFASDASGNTSTISMRKLTLDGTTTQTLNTSVVGTTNITITGDMACTPGTASNDPGGFQGTTAKTTVLRIQGNFNSTSTNTSQKIMGSTGTNTVEFNGSSAQTIGYPASVTSLTIFAGVQFKINNSAGVTLTNNSASACTFTMGASSSFVGALGALSLGAADIFAYPANATATFSGGVISDITWPASNGPVNIVIDGAAVLSGNRTISGVLTLTSGTLDLSTFSLTLTGSSPVRTSGSIDASNGSANMIFNNSSPITLPASIFTGNVNRLTMNNSGNVTSSDGITVSDSLEMSNGLLIMGSNTITIGTSTSNVGTLTRTGGSIRGNIRRWFGTTTTTNTIFPLNNGATDYVAPVISFTNAPTQGGTLTASYHTSGSGTLSDNGGLGYIPAPQLGVNFINLAPQYWTITAADGLESASFLYDIKFKANNMNLSTTNYQYTGLAKRHDNTQPWAWDYTNHTTTADSNGLSLLTVAGHGFNSFSDFGVVGNVDNLLPVELSTFTANVERRNVNLKWTTAVEENNVGFDVERKPEGAATWSKLNFVRGNGTSNSPHNYTYEDRNISTGKYNYRLKQTDNNGNYKYYTLTTLVEIGVPTKYDMSQNYPNPFNPTTKINYDLPFDSKVSIRLYDMTGREVATILNQNVSAGYQTVQFNASNLSSGTYFYNIIAEGNNSKFITTKKMVLVK